MIQSNGKYYVYRHIRLDSNQVFYIGIGTKKLKKPNCYTCIYERAYSKFPRSKFWTSITNITDYEVEILLESDSKDFIEEKEAEFIKLYGRRDLNEGTLCNFKDKTRGGRGKPITEEQKRKLSEKNKGAKRSEETRKRMSEASKGKRKSPEHIEKLRQKAILEWKNGRKYSINAIKAMTHARITNREKRKNNTN